jgi:hypothetical protein
MEQLRMKRRRTWVSLTAAAATVPVAMGLPTAFVKIERDGIGLENERESGGLPTLAYGIPSAYATSGGEGGEGGEAGIDAATAGDDPVVYLTGLDVMAAHFHAGLAAYLAGEKEEGAMMFAHAISEAYVDMEPAFKKLGVAPFDAALQEATNLGNDKAPDDAVKAAVQKALDAITAAAAKAPKSTAGIEITEAKVFLDMLNRSALQLIRASKGDGDDDAYLDGFGFLVAAKARAPAALKALDAVGPEAGAAARDAMSALERDYPAITPPKTPAIEPGAVMAAVSKAILAAGSL